MDACEARAISWYFRHLKNSFQNFSRCRSRKCYACDVDAKGARDCNDSSGARFDVLFPMPLINYLRGFWQAFKEESFIISNVAHIGEYNAAHMITVQ